MLILNQFSKKISVRFSSKFAANDPTASHMRRYTAHAAVVGGPASPAMAWPLFLPQIF